MNATLLEWCQRLIGCPSVTSEGTREIVQLCAHELLQPNGLEPRLLPSQSEGSSQVNLVCRVRGREHGCAPLILNTHLDTVPAGNPAAWTECPQGPFVAILKGERIYGLGAADTKLDFVAKMLALIECGIPRRDVYLIATFGEEHGLIGAKELAGAGIIPRGALAYVGEPSHLQVVTAHKGLMVFELEIQFLRYSEARRSFPLYHLIFEGRSAHSSTPALGLNAIQIAVESLKRRSDLRIAGISGGDAVNKVPAQCIVACGGEPVRPIADMSRLEHETGAVVEFVPGEIPSLLATFIARLSDFAKGSDRPEPDYAPPALTFNVGLIQSTDRAMTVQFEFRPPPSLPLDDIRHGIGEVVEALSSAYPNNKLNLTERRANPGFRSSGGNEAVELAMTALALADLPLESGVKAGCTEAGVYAGAGISPVVFGPGPSTGVIHAANEYNLVSEVEGALRFYRELLRI